MESTTIRKNHSTIVQIRKSLQMMRQQQYPSS